MKDFVLLKFLIIVLACNTIHKVYLIQILQKIID
jgi:hypothetical protein